MPHYCTASRHSVQCLQPAAWRLTVACLHEHIGTDYVCPAELLVIDRLMAPGGRGMDCQRCLDHPTDPHSCPVTITRTLL
jgi:hypothetical protein